MHLLLESVHTGPAALFPLLPNGPCLVALGFKESDCWASPGNATFPQCDAAGNLLASKQV